MAFAVSTGAATGSVNGASTPQRLRFGPYLTGLPHDLLQGLYRYLSISDRIHLARVSGLCVS